MKFQSHAGEELTIDLTSLIDVVFILLLFFMVSTTFERHAALRIDLPEASTADPAQAPQDRLELAIDAEGRMYLDDRQLINNDRNTVMAALQEAAGNDRDRPLILRADRETPHHFVVTAMDAVAELGFTNLSIAADRTAGPAE